MPSVQVKLEVADISRAWGIPAVFQKLEPKSWASGFLWGAAGVGKTHEAVRRLMQVVTVYSVSLDREHRGYFVTSARLLSEIRLSFNGSADAGAVDHLSVLDHATWRRYLVLDDLGAENVTNWAIEQIGMLLDARWSNGLPTIVTSNLSLGRIGNEFGDRIASRLAGLGNVEEIVGPDRRLTNA